jgi:hypothetical protein
LDAITEASRGFEMNKALACGLFLAWASAIFYRNTDYENHFSFLFAVFIAICIHFIWKCEE